MPKPKPNLNLNLVDGQYVKTEDGLRGTFKRYDKHGRAVVLCHGDDKERAYHPSKICPLLPLLGKKESP